MAHVIEAKNLFKRYAGFAPVLRGVSMEVEPGEMVAVMGPSGCGKSTMLHVLGMLHAPDSGSLEILGVNALALNREEVAAFRRGNMGFVMQASNLFDHSTVFENVEFPLIYENIPPRERWERVIRALELVRLSNRVHYRSNRLSGGEQQRVAIARAMVNNPRILLADEPTGALDAKTSVLIMENFRALCHSGGVSMVMVTHDPKMADYCDSIYALEDGLLHSRKHSVPAIVLSDHPEFSKAPAPVVDGALIAASFFENAQAQVLAENLHNQKTLSSIYSLGGSGKIFGSSNYSLPLPVQIAGAGSRWLRACSMLLGAYGDFRNLGKKLASRLGKRLSAMACASQLVEWIKTENIEFLQGADADMAGAAAWGCAQKMELPFAFAVQPGNLDNSDGTLQRICADAAFITCPTTSVRSRLLELSPALPQEKVILARPPLLFSPDREENPAPEAGNPFAILAVADDFIVSDLRLLLEACKRLQNSKTTFELTISSSRTRILKWRLLRQGLRSRVTVVTTSEKERLEELYKTSAIFIAASKFPDALPMSVCEAMAFGLGIISLHRTPGLDEALVDEENALTGRGKSSDVLAQALESFLGDPAYRKKLGDAAIKDITTLLSQGSNSRQIVDLTVMAAGARDRAKERARDTAGKNNEI